MPVMACQKGNRPGFKWGREGKCYVYQPDNARSRAAARARAARQGRAIEARQKQ